MLSGNGRHRRPRQAPAFLVAAGVTGSALTIPLLAAGGASAADGTTWDKVAKCETGGSWSENSGSGRYGGLQLSQAQWERYGGLDYALRADLASRNQQIAVAGKLLADQGVGAFDSCGRTSGLTKDDASAEVDTGVAGDSSGSSGASGSSESSGSSSSSGSGSTGLSNASGDTAGDDSSSADPSASPYGSASTSASPSASASSGSSSDSVDKSGETDTSASPSGSGAGGEEKGGGSGKNGSKSDDSGNPEQAEGSWSLVDTGALGAGRHRGASADEDGATGGEHAASGGAHGSYTVRVGDTLSSIVDSLGLDGGWRALYAENEQRIGADPNRIVAGQTLKLPA